MGFQSSPSIMLSIMSVIAGTLVMLIVVVLRLRQPNVARTASFILSFWIGLSDALYRGTLVVSKQYEFVESHLSEALVRYLFWSEYFYPVWFMFLTVMVGLDLQLTFVHHLINPKKFQPYYFPAATIFAFMITLPALLVPTIYWNRQIHGFSWTFGSALRDNLFIILGFNIWMGMGVLYCAIIVSIVAHRLISDMRHWSINKSLLIKPSTFSVELHRSVARIMLYPLVPIITQSLNVVVDWLPFDSPVAERVRQVGSILASTQGILNLTVFLLNPALHRAFSNLRDQLVKETPTDHSLQLSTFPFNKEPFLKALADVRSEPAGGNRFSLSFDKVSFSSLQARDTDCLSMNHETDKDIHCHTCPNIPFPTPSYHCVTTPKRAGSVPESIIAPIHTQDCVDSGDSLPITPLTRRGSQPHFIHYHFSLTPGRNGLHPPTTLTTPRNVPLILNHPISRPQDPSSDYSH
ncbi:hypothetical protein IWQ61_005527 [Dispira simplex]|nr:hypothetical protein IWQ61_005527 [Dispira simplex]